MSAGRRMARLPPPASAGAVSLPKAIVVPYTYQ